MCRGSEPDSIDLPIERVTGKTRDSDRLEAFASVIRFDLDVMEPRPKTWLGFTLERR